MCLELTTSLPATVLSLKLLWLRLATLPPFAAYLTKARILAPTGIVDKASASDPGTLIREDTMHDYPNVQQW